MRPLRTSHMSSLAMRSCSYSCIYIAHVFPLSLDRLLHTDQYSRHLSSSQLALCPSVALPSRTYGSPLPCLPLPPCPPPYHPSPLPLPSHPPTPRPLLHNPHAPPDSSCLRNWPPLHLEVEGHNQPKQKEGDKDAEVDGQQNSIFRWLIPIS